MAVITTQGPRPSTPSLSRTPDQFIPFVNGTTAPALLKQLAELETLYKAGKTALSRTDFVRSQMQLIADVYQYYYNELARVSQQTLKVPIESIISAVSQTASTKVPQPFGVLLKGFGYYLGKIAQQSITDQLTRAKAEAQFYVSDMEKLQSQYEVYQAELSRVTYSKIALVGLPLALLVLKNKLNGNDNKSQ